ncbi:BTB/POZ domain-containing protein 17-like [Heterodontus francisci]|uniref:BTB/POZ domain-containing protein 17-like n=1 Tax=Heterodontus francisci TaxID=7792 RepID=UPI00355B5621
MMDAKEPTETLDHQSKFMGTFSTLFNKEELSDIQLIVNKKLTLKAHRFILAVHSDVFKSMLDTKRWSDSKRQIVNLTEEEDCVAYFQDFLRYLYSGTVTLSSENVLSLHILSEKYNIQELRESSQRFMLANVASLGTSNHAITWHRYAKLVGLGQLEEECLRFIVWNVGTVIKSPDWALIEPHQLSALLQRNDMVVEDEVVLFQALVSWLSLHPTHTEEMLAHIRYPMMSPEKLFDLQVPGCLPERIASYLLRESLLIYQAQVLSMEAIGQRHDITALPFTMRMYTSGSFSQLWDIPGYQAMNKTALSTSLSTRLFQVKTQWTLTYSPKGQTIITQQKDYNYSYNGYRQVVQEDDFSTLTVWLNGCEAADTNHSHKLSVLLYRCVSGHWFVCDVKTLQVPHTGNVKINDLIPLSERDKYVSNDTMKLHLIGHTIWEKY